MPRPRARAWAPSQSLERVLLAVYPIEAYVVMAWGLVGLVGPYRAPFYLALQSAVFLWLYCMPLTSSFRYPIADSRATSGLPPFVKPEPDAGRTYSVRQGYVLDGVELVVMTGFFQHAPAIAYLLLNAGAIRENFTQLTDLFVLAAIPLMAIWYLSRRGFLWWAGTWRHVSSWRPPPPPASRRRRGGAVQRR